MNIGKADDWLRPLSPAGRRVVQTAEELFYNQGITAVGVDLIAEHSGVSKRTLYNQFGSKEHLVAAYLLCRFERWRTLVEDAIDASRDPLEALIAPFIALEQWSTSNLRGCAFINALAEIPDPAHPAHRIATDQKIWLRDLFERLAMAARSTAPTELSTQLLLLHEGALATQALHLGTLRASIDLARELAQGSIPNR